MPLKLTITRPNAAPVRAPSPAAASDRGWETKPPDFPKPKTPLPAALPTPPNSPQQSPRSSPPSTPPIASQTAAPPKRYAASQSPPNSFLLQRPNTTPAGNFHIATDKAGHKAYGLSARQQLSPTERNMHDHWFGRIDRNFSTHAKEFEMLAEPVTSWQGYLKLAKSVLAQKNSPTTSSQKLADGKTATYDKARNLLVFTASDNADIITMYRPGVNHLPESQQPKVLEPLLQGQRYVAKLR